MIEPINYGLALRRGWRLLVVLAVIFGIVAVLMAVLYVLFERTRIGGRIDHRGDEALSAEIEHAGGKRKIADRYTYDRRRPALPHGGDAGEHRGDVPQSVLTLDRYRRKAFAAERFGNQRVGQAAPAAEDCFSGAQPAGEGECGYGHGVCREAYCDVCWATLAEKDGSPPGLFAGLDVGDRLFHQLGHEAIDLVIGFHDVLGGEILVDFA